MKILFILLIILLVNYTIIYFLRKQRDRVNVTTPTGKLKVKRLNQTIDILTGFWIWSFSRKKK